MYTDLDPEERWEEVETRREKLLEKYDVAFEEESYEMPEDDYDDFLSSMGDCLGGAYVAVIDEGKALLISEEGVDPWKFPGGRIERDESFEGGAKREVWEETNIEPSIDDSFLVKQAVIESESRDAVPLLYAFFVGQRESGEIELHDERWEEGEEIQEARWFEFDERPDEEYDAYEIFVELWRKKSQKS